MARFIQIPLPNGKVELLNSDFVSRVEFDPAYKPITVEVFFVEEDSLNSYEVVFSTKERATDWIEKNFIFFNK